MRFRLLHAGILFFATSFSTCSARAQSATATAPAMLEPRFDVANIPLWDPSTNPAAAADTGLTIFYPQAGRANGAAVVVAPGGAYARLAMNIEGRQVADWFASRGFVAVVLKYRVGAQHPYPEALQDGQRAIRVVRSMSAQWKIQPDKIGMAGFSAGGHLAAMVSVSADAGNPSAADPAKPADPIARFSDRPDFVVLGYPWLNAFQPNSRGFITYCSVMKVFTPDQCKAWETPYTPALHVTAGTPPTFIYSTTNDSVVPVSASVDYYSALMHAGASAEMHIYRRGSHGSGLGSGDASLDTWPQLLENWLRSQNFM